MYDVYTLEMKFVPSKTWLRWSAPGHAHPHPTSSSSHPLVQKCMSHGLAANSPPSTNHPPPFVLGT